MKFYLIELFSLCEFYLMKLLPYVDFYFSLIVADFDHKMNGQVNRNDYPYFHRKRTVSFDLCGNNLVIH
jgi:hypothetical protein